MLSSISVEELKAIEGEVRGVTLLTDAEFVLGRFGRVGMEQLQETLVNMGCPIDYPTVKAMQWYPLRMRLFSLLAMQQTFSLSDGDIRHAGNAAPKHSFIVKLMMKFFVSAPVAFGRIGDYWTRHYTVGRVEGDLIEAEGQALVRLVDFKTHPLLCRYLEGYFQRLFEYLIPGKEIKLEETECLFTGGAQHLFKATWKP